MVKMKFSCQKIKQNFIQKLLILSPLLRIVHLSLNVEILVFNSSFLPAAKFVQKLKISIQSLTKLNSLLYSALHNMRMLPYQNFGLIIF